MYVTMSCDSDVWARPATICIRLYVLAAPTECQHLDNKKTENKKNNKKISALEL